MSDGPYLAGHAGQARLKQGAGFGQPRDELGQAGVRVGREPDAFAAPVEQSAGEVGPAPDAALDGGDSVLYGAGGR